jgi:hypothetical protein
MPASEGSACNPPFDIDEISLPETDEYPPLWSINEHTDSYVASRVHDNEVVKIIAGATRLVHRILKQRGDEQSSSRVTRDLAYYLIQFHAVDIDSLVMGHRVNPYLDLLLEARDYVSKGVPANAVSLSSDSLPPEVQAQITDVAARIRQRGAAPEWQKRVETILRKCRDNHKSLTEYLDAQFRDRRSRHLVIRIDLGYAKDHAALMSRPSTISEEQAKADLEKFIRHVRENYPLTGFARRLEYGVYSGIHFHLLILLDGHKRLQGGRIAHLLGEHWRELVTEGQGRYYNCNRATYRHRGIGLVHHSDRQLRHNLLEYAGRYLTKADFWVEGESTGKSFVRGQMPNEAKCMGRPRTRLEGPCVVQR